MIQPMTDEELEAIRERTDPDIGGDCIPYHDRDRLLAEVDRLRALDKLAREYFELIDLRGRRIERTTSGKACHSVDGHGSSGRCDCYEKDEVAVRETYRAAVEGEK